MGIFDDEEENRTWYDGAQVCLNGHAITQFAKSEPANRKDFCPKCGAETMDSCRECGSKIQGKRHVPGVVSLGTYEPPAFCCVCGRPYPWTVSRLEAARALADETDGLSEPETIALKATLDDLIRDTPQSAVAVVRFKKLVAKGGAQVGQAFKDILVDIVSETVRKGIWGP